MRAARYHSTGPAAEVLEVSDVKRPSLEPGDVLVRIAYSGINPTDVKARSGAVPRPIDGFQIPHHDGAGVIEAVGAAVDPARVGERVWVMFAATANKYGTAAEFCAVKSEFAQPLPANCDFELGATVGVPAVTAAYCLFADGPIKDTNVLISGGAGAVGRAAIQLAKWGGARVFATVSSDEKAEIARAAGADVVVNYRDDNAQDQLRGQGISRIVEVNLADNMELDIAIAQPGMKIISYAADGDDPIMPRRPFMAANISIEFMLIFNVMKSKFAGAVDAVNRALAEGALTMPPSQLLSLDDIVSAHELVEGHVAKRVLIQL